jgi:hypothetical protein
VTQMSRLRRGADSEGVLVAEGDLMLGANVPGPSSIDALVKQIEAMLSLGPLLGPEARGEVRNPAAFARGSRL